MFKSVPLVRNFAKIALSAMIVFAGTSTYSQPKKTDYFPPADNWERRIPAQLGLRDSSISNAVAYALLHEAHSSHNGAIAQFQNFGKEPNSTPIGPLTNREGPAGMIIYKGYIIATWGDPSRVEIVNSASKSFLSASIGLAVDRGLIRSTLDTVAKAVPFVEMFNRKQIRQPLSILLPLHITGSSLGK